MRTVFLHADDFGMNAAVNSGILHGFRHGLLTSTSVLANAPASVEGLRQWRDLQNDCVNGRLPSIFSRKRLNDPGRAFDLGVHLNLTQGRPLSRDYPAELLDSDGRFPGIFRLYFTLSRSPGRYREAVLRELTAQVSFVCERGFAPSHVNGHQYVELIPEVGELIPGLMFRFGIPVCRLARESAGNLPLVPWRWIGWQLARVKERHARLFAKRLAIAGVPHPDAFHGASHAGRITRGVMRWFLKQASWGSLEIAFHPGAALTAGDAVENGWHDPLAALRPREMNLLASPELAALLEPSRFALGRLNLLDAHGSRKVA